MLESWWCKIPVKFASVQTDAYIVMPNHIHGIMFFGDKNELLDSKAVVSNISVPRVVQWFKTMAANEYQRRLKDTARSGMVCRLWQRNYYEHVIRNDDSLDKIREYIMNNPYHWFDDENYAESFS